MSNQVEEYIYTLNTPSRIEIRVASAAAEKPAVCNIDAA